MKRDEKYVVIKRSDAERMRANVPGGTILDTLVFSDIILDDAVVIRTQDVFAEVGLRAYAGNIRAHIALIRSGMDDMDTWQRTTAMEMIDRLYHVADYFNACAHEAEDRMDRGECKVPD